MRDISRKKRGANGLDALRVYSAFVVVMLHVAAQGFYTIQPYWNTAIVYNAIGRVAVPLFFMLSGAVMIPRNESLLELGKRIFKRVLCPYIAWSIIYIFRKGYISGSYIPLSSIFLQAPFFHLPFMFQLLMLYLAFPLLQGFWNNPGVNDRKKRYVIGISLLSGVLCEFVPIVIGRTILGFGLSYLPYYVGLAMLGAYIYERRERYTNFTKVNIFIYLICCVITACLTKWKTFSLGTPSEVFWAYQSPILMLGAASLFVFASCLKLPEGKHSFLLDLSSSTFAIYLMHPLLLDILASGEIGVTVSWNTFYPLFGIPLVSVAVFLICACCSIMWKKAAALLQTKTRYR